MTRNPDSQVRRRISRAFYVRARWVALIMLMLGFAPGLSLAATLSGRVVGITDGDTLRVLTPSKEVIVVRLVEIDAPEKGQPWGQKSKEALSRLAYQQSVRVVVKGVDRYGRTLGRIYVGRIDINAEMVRGGGAWAYRAYLTDLSLIGIESGARRARRGLWSMPDNQTVPPWDWRRGGSRSTRAPQQAPGSVIYNLSNPATPGPQRCGSKRYCREMASCQEARHYLKQCGLATIDGDGDGTPCEALCAPR